MSENGREGWDECGGSSERGWEKPPLPLKTKRITNFSLTQWFGQNCCLTPMYLVELYQPVAFHIV